jgi:hypothetical protein
MRLPRGEELKVVGPKGQSRLIRVSILLDNNGNWDEALVRNTFPPIDVDVTFRIKLSRRRPGDFLAWQHEKNGGFSIPSAYRLGLRLAQQDRQPAAISATPLGDKTIWGKFGSAMCRKKFTFLHGRLCLILWVRRIIIEGDIFQL